MPTSQTISALLGELCKVNAQIEQAENPTGKPFAGPTAPPPPADAPAYPELVRDAIVSPTAALAGMMQIRSEDQTLLDNPYTPVAYLYAAGALMRANGMTIEQMDQAMCAVATVLIKADHERSERSGR